MNKRALYNSLRMNWLLDPQIEVDQWQVADYRTIGTEDLFAQLKPYGFSLNKESFSAFAEDEDSPEDFTDSLVDDSPLKPDQQDFIYLVVFELWRRLLPEKLCLSVFCDELDHIIFNYDQNKLDDPEAIEDMLSNLLLVLEENSDEGVEPQDAFSTLSEHCANDVENFLVDFIQDQIESKNEDYASELIEDFARYVQEPKWLDYLQAQIFASTEPATANLIIRTLVENASEENDLEFNFSLLYLLVQQGDEEVFVDLVKQTFALLEVEEDFQELLAICADHYRLLDAESQETQIQTLLQKRATVKPDKNVDLNDPDFHVLAKIMN